MSLFPAQQAQIAAIHERSGVADQAVRVPTSGRIFPFDRGECRLQRPERLRGDLAGSATKLLDVVSQQKLDQPRPL